MRRDRRRSLRLLTNREPCAPTLTSRPVVTSVPVTSFLALPPPSAATGASAPSGFGRLRQMAASEAIPVTPVRPVAEPGQRAAPFQDGEVEATDEAVRRHRQTGRGDERGRAGETRGGGTAFRFGDSLPPERPVHPSPMPRGMGPTIAFLTQTIAQEAMGTGLHIEPWRTALGAYHRAGSGGHGPLVSNVAV